MFVPHRHRVCAERHQAGGHPLPSVPNGTGRHVSGDNRLLNGGSDGLKHCGQSLAFGPRRLEMLRQGLTFPPARLEIARWR